MQQVSRKLLIVRAMPLSQEPLVVSLKEETYAENEDVRIECGGASTTASGGWSLGNVLGKDVGDEASEWLTNYFSRFPNSRVQLLSPSPAPGCSCV